jgi:hypothetical protein
MHRQLRSVKLKRRDLLVYRGINGRIILKWDIKTWIRFDLDRVQWWAFVKTVRTLGSVAAGHSWTDELVPRSRIVEIYLQSPICLHGILLNSAGHSSRVV